MVCSTIRRPRSLALEEQVQDAAMTAGERTLCHCSQPCACYAAGKDEVYFEVIASLDSPPHAEGCACQPCQVKRACLQNVMILMARSSPGIF